MDDTRGCCKFCGRDLEPGETCSQCLAIGLDPARYSLDEALAMRARAGHACLLDIESDREMMIGKQRWGIGRHPSNELPLNDAYVSRFHARITDENDQYYLEDLGSTNGTLINGAALTSRRPLSHGDKIRIGKSEFIFVVPGVRQASGTK